MSGGKLNFWDQKTPTYILTKKYSVHPLKLVSRECSAWCTVHLRLQDWKKSCEQWQFLITSCLELLSSNQRIMLLECCCIKVSEGSSLLSVQENDKVYSSQQPHVEATLRRWVWKPWKPCKAQDDISSTLSEGQIFH